MPTAPLSEHTFVFDEACPNWNKEPDYNRVFLQAVENYLTDRLRMRGHLFLNEVLDALGLDRVPEGQKYGWLYEQDKKVSFGATEKENAYLLEFNIDPDEIWEKI